MNAVKAMLIILLWIAAALAVIWAQNAAAASEWRFDCNGTPVRFGFNALTVGDQKSLTLLTSSTGVARKADGHEIPVITYEFEGSVYLVVDDSGDPDAAGLISEGQAIWCERT
ncbi:MAG: hypothetical protein G3W58_22885 [Pantoea ananatis]|nr:hypothetical protein [Pantoea ananatis]